MSKYLKGMLAALVIGLIVGVVGLSQANYNIRQNSDGTTDWVDSGALDVGGSPVVRVGRHYITLSLTTASVPATFYVVSPISGVLYSAFAVQNSSAVTAITTTLTFGVMQPVSPGNFIHPTTAGWLYLVPTNQVGTVFYNRPGTQGAPLSGFTGGRTPFVVTKMEGQPGVRLGGVISIGVGGEGSDAAGNGAGQYDIIIIIDPR